MTLWPFSGNACFLNYKIFKTRQRCGRDRRRELNECLIAKDERQGFGSTRAANASLQTQRRIWQACQFKLALEAFSRAQRHRCSIFTSIFATGLQRRALLGSQASNPRYHRQCDVPSCLALAISALALTSLIFRFALPRLQKARALLGSSRMATLKSAMARS